MFAHGQKVVCVDDADRGPAGPWVTKGTVYTVKSSVELCVGPCISVCELPDQDRLNYFYWRASRFRHLIIRKTDIGVFTAMLDPATRPKLIPVD